MKKVLLITYYWPPCGGAGVQRALKFAHYLPQLNVIPYIVTVDENKASYPVKDKSLLNDIPQQIKVFRTDTTEPFGLYSLFTSNKNIPHSGFANDSSKGIVKSMMRFLRGNFYIPDARKGWNKHAYKKIKEILCNETFEAIITSSPPHSTQLLGLQLKKEFGIKWIADMRDPWTDIYYYKDMLHLGFAKKKDAAYEKTVLENADEILVVSDSIKNIFKDKSDKINPDKIHVIPNGYDENDFSMLPPASQSSFVITYTGTIASNYGIENFISVLAGIVKQNNNTNIKLRFAGNIDGLFKHLIEKADISDNVEYLGYVSHSDSIKFLLSSSALLMAIPNTENNEGILTGKLFEYLASRKPIICIGPVKGDASKIIEECEAGKTFGYDENEHLKQYIQTLINSWKIDHDIDRKNDLHIKYSRLKQTEKLCNIIKK